MRSAGSSRSPSASKERKILAEIDHADSHDGFPPLAARMVTILKLNWLPVFGIVYTYYYAISERGVSAVLRNSGFGISLLINIIIICLWVFLSNVIAGHIGPKHVDYRKFPFRIGDFEKHGKFYTENFDIESWYQFLPAKYNRIGITESLHSRYARDTREPSVYRGEPILPVSDLERACEKAQGA